MALPGGRLEHLHFRNVPVAEFLPINSPSATSTEEITTLLVKHLSLSQ